MMAPTAVASLPASPSALVRQDNKLTQWRRISHGRTGGALRSTPKCRHILNRVLLSLPPDLCDYIVRLCERVELSAGFVICAAGAPLEYAYFVNSGLVSIIRATEDGRSVEIGTIGAEGLIGVFPVYGFERTSADFVVQVPVSALRINIKAFKNEIMKSEALRDATMRFIFLATEQLAQVSLCNRLHSLKQRYCHWLLTAHDNISSDEFHLTHEFLALLLGAQRPSVSVIAHELQDRGLIHYAYGRIKIINRAALERASCSCYGALRRQIEYIYGH